MKLMPALQRLFVAVAGDSGLSKQAFSFSSPAGRCETCKGTGRSEVAMDVLADLVVPCPACSGARYRPEVLAVRWQGHTVADVLAMSVVALGELLGKAEGASEGKSAVGKLLGGIDTMVRVGLGHLGLGRRRSDMSGGESQRLTLAASLLDAPTPTLYLFDEPATGLHEHDLARLVAVFQGMAKRGDLVIAAEHRTSLVRAADWVIDLGPGGGPSGGRLVAMGPPAELRDGVTAASLRGGALPE
ncbi:MAG: hypothetical protein JKY37_16885 [Nannocystaceae bacterium]|nr:hypothetical protein [Nannocystaceae bacterium]